MTHPYTHLMVIGQDPIRLQRGLVMLYGKWFDLSNPLLDDDLMHLDIWDLHLPRCFKSWLHQPASKVSQSHEIQLFPGHIQPVVPELYDQFGLTFAFSPLSSQNNRSPQVYAEFLRLLRTLSERVVLGASEVPVIPPPPALFLN